MWAFDSEQDKRFSNMVGQLSLVVKIELLKVFQDVIEAAQTSPPLGFSPAQHR